MEVSEERELKRISAEFTKGIDLFRQRRYPEALTVFDNIGKDFKNSEFYSVVEIETRSKVYKKICEAQLNPVKIELHADEDFLYDGIFHLNAGRLSQALERFNYLLEKKYGDPYLSYLLSIVHLKMNDKGACLERLKKAIDEDESYKIIAHNEPDFDPLFDNQVFLQLTERN
jgi:tetratricopeptide (TPR) repeat protein